jgi:hypothetical protein
VSVKILPIRAGNEHNAVVYVYGPKIPEILYFTPLVRCAIFTPDAN